MSVEVGYKDGFASVLEYAGGELEAIVGALALRDVFDEQDDAANGVVVVTPGEDLPTQPDDRSIRSGEAILDAFKGLACKALAVRLLPAFRDIRHDVIVALPDDFAFDRIYLAPPAAHGQIAHIAVVHGERRGGVLNEEFEPFLGFAQRCFGGL